MIAWFEFMGENLMGETGRFRIVHEMREGKPKCGGPTGSDPLQALTHDTHTRLLLSVGCVHCDQNERWAEHSHLPLDSVTIRRG